MRVIIISDFEGISGVHTFRQVIKEFGKPFARASVVTTCKPPGKSRRIRIGQRKQVCERVCASGLGVRVSSPSGVETV